MTGTHETPSLEKPLDILANCLKHNPQDDAYLRHEPYRVCRRVNILRDYSDEKTKLYPRN